MEEFLYYKNSTLFYWQKSMELEFQSSGVFAESLSKHQKKMTQIFSNSNLSFTKLLACFPVQIKYCRSCKYSHWIGFILLKLPYAAKTCHLILVTLAWLWPLLWFAYVPTDPNRDESRVATVWVKTTLQCGSFYCFRLRLLSIARGVRGIMETLSKWVR